MADRRRVLVWIAGLALAVGLAPFALDRLASRRAAGLTDGVSALGANDLDTAARAFDATLAGEPGLADLAAFDLGVVRASQRRSGDAIAAFARAAELARTYGLRASAHYNRGIVLAEQGALPQSLTAFAQALRADPRHERARVNYAIVKARLARDDARRAKDPSADNERNRERQIQQTPDQVYGFTAGRRATRPVRSATDW